LFLQQTLPCILYPLGKSIQPFIAFSRPGKDAAARTFPRPTVTPIENSNNMDKITDKIANLPADANYFSLEFFPPKTQAGFSNLQGRLSRMALALRPLFVTVTWGAGGSTAAKSLELAEVCQRQLGLTTVLHFTCTNMNRKLVDEALEEAKALGLRNILALRGDPPRSEEYAVADQEHEDSNKEFTWAIDLVRYIRKVHGDYFCIGVAGYPEGHADESHPEHQSVEQDLPYLIEKTKAGADFIMTQLTYDIQAYQKYEDTLRNHESGIFKNIPIIPGLMPIQNYGILKRITKLSHVTVPTKIMDRVEAVKSDDNAVKKVGVEIMSEIVQSMKSLSQPQDLPRGFHFYTLNLEKSVAFILERCHLIPTSSEATPSETSESESDIIDGQQTTGQLPPSRFSKRRASSVNAGPHNRVLVDRPALSVSSHATIAESSTSEKHQAPDRGAGIPASQPTRSNNLLISEGHGSLGREATWDDFPNGRWGPSNSPAFGEIDGYGPSLKVGPATARKLWNHPNCRDDITKMFVRHVNGELSGVPWSDELGSDAGAGSLREETKTIKDELLDLIQEQGLWTIASQPAVNGVPSGDPIFGWGPKGEGFVFQKAFVEFFVSRKQWEEELKPRLQRFGEAEVSWLKTDCDGVFESSTTAQIGETNGVDARTSKPTPGMTGVNAVTWGVFRGKEIVTPTIIEELSFRAWGEEAYGIWEEWRRVFARGSEEEGFLLRCKREVVLVNVVGQRFVRGEGGRLWDILLGREVGGE
jgi:methylenetetrahydrofolate reductase (NADPH)